MLNHKWTRIYVEKDVELFPFYLWAKPWFDNVPNLISANLSPIALLFSRNGVEYFVDRDKYIEFGKKVFNKFDSSKSYRQIVKKTKYYLNILQDKSSKLERIDFSNSKSSELFELINELASDIESLNAWGQLVSAMEYGPNNLLTDGIMNVLTKSNKSDKSLTEVLSILSSPIESTFIRMEKNELLDLAIQIVKEDNLRKIFIENELDKVLVAIDEQYPNFFKLINNHVSKYCWINYGYRGPSLNIEYFLTNLKDLVRDNNLKSLTSLLKKNKEEFKLLKNQQKILEEEFHLDNYWKNRFKIIREQTWLKEIRKETIFHALYVIELIQFELSKRFNLDVTDLRQLLPEEYWKLEGDLDSVKKKVWERKKMCVYLLDDSGPKILIGDEAANFSKSLLYEEEIEAVDEIKGSCACPGKAKGIVKVIMGETHLEKMEKGDILVSFSTNPLMVPAMKKAAAIITDVGGITSHAAIVSRELRIPCVVGVKVGTKVLKDGDLVEVDATRGIVKILN